MPLGTAIALFSTLAHALMIGMLLLLPETRGRTIANLDPATPDRPRIRPRFGVPQNNLQKAPHMVARPVRRADPALFRHHHVRRFDNGRRFVASR